MASRRPIEYLSSLSGFVRGRPIHEEEEIGLELLNLANDSFCSYKHWRWLTSSAPAMDVSNTQVYSWAPAVEILNIPIVYGVSGQGRISHLVPLTSAPSVNSDGMFPSVFEYLPIGTITEGEVSIRVWPQPASGIRGKLVPLVKHSHVKVTPENKGNANVLPHPDDYDHIYIAFLLDFIYLFAQVGALSAIQMNARGQFQTTGSLARAYELADKIVETEALLIDSKGQLKT